MYFRAYAQMLELKVRRCCELNNEQQLSAILFIGKSCDSDDYVIVVIISDTLSSSYTATYDQQSWEALRKEAEFSTDEEFIAELANEKNSLNMERSEYVQIKWIRPDEDGLTFEFCTLTLKLDTTWMYDIMNALLKERNIYYDNAIREEAVVASMERRLVLLGKKVEEMDDYRQNLSNTLISKFVAIQNEKVTS
ncbi:unnamed protein product [Wuchereria bancrofti]|uniref:Uncharacterized protein n=2 Tax=Wuchereria bancrofti TaxID=6293 RepID=A0A3P7G9I2_WUCBA|nr:unnamed protein product [Wuchereria bancrofti]